MELPFINESEKKRPSQANENGKHLHHPASLTKMILKDVLHTGTEKDNSRHERS